MLFYNCVITIAESLSDTIRDGLQDLACRATGMSTGHSDVTFETVSSVSQFPNYRPVTIPVYDHDRYISPPEAANRKPTLAKTLASLYYCCRLL